VCSAVWLLRSLAPVLALAVLSGCSDSKTYNAREVARALGSQGFHAGAVEADPKLTGVLENADGVDEVVVELKPYAAFRPGSVPTVGDLVLGAFVFDEVGKASCPEPNVIGECFKRRNVVILFRANRARAAREALADL
jgi:hypothetical protein